MNVLAGKMTSSPGPMPPARSASSIASVPLATATQSVTPVKCRELALEGGDLGAADEGRPGENFLPALGDFVGDDGVLSG